MASHDALNQRHSIAVSLGGTGRHRIRMGRVPVEIVSQLHDTGSSRGREGSSVGSLFRYGACHNDDLVGSSSSSHRVLKSRGYAIDRRSGVVVIDQDELYAYVVVSELREDILQTVDRTDRVRGHNIRTASARAKRNANIGASNNRLLSINLCLLAYEHNGVRGPLERQ